MAEDETPRLHGDLLRLALRAEWLAVMIEWELEREGRTPERRAWPFYGVKAPMHTKSKTRQRPDQESVTLAA